MAKKKELTVEEKLAQEKQNALNNIKRELAYINDPSFYFNLGDKVRYGNLKESIVDEILYDGKVYGLRCIATKENRSMSNLLCTLVDNYVQLNKQQERLTAYYNLISNINKSDTE